MEIIGHGILLAIGFYVAPLVAGAVIMTVSVVGVLICQLFGGCK